MGDVAFGQPAVEVVQLWARWQYPEGWSLRITRRHSGQHGPQSWSQDLYEGMDSPELLQVTEDALTALLGLG